ncbi:MAG: DUF3347 domain-containing protein, partial [Chitinophagaceae bacterium]
MKKIIFMVAIFATASAQQIFAQQTSKDQPADLLTSYYNIKDALVSGDANTASLSAEQFVKALNSSGMEMAQKSNKDALLKDAATIAGTKDLKKQREAFSAFSDNMFTLAKAVKLSDEPVYQQYCPMKKASWLSSTKAI